MRNSEKAVRPTASAGGVGSSRAQRGAAAEAIAAQYLMQRGLRIIERNYRCRGGEIDLIAADGATLVFVEVRLRKSDRFGGAAASVTFDKQRRVILAAHHYLAGGHARACRFDVITLESLDMHSVTWIRDAFTTS